jgi:hypothetical protein
VLSQIGYDVYRILPLKIRNQFLDDIAEEKELEQVWFTIQDLIEECVQKLIKVYDDNSQLVDSALAKDIKVSLDVLVLKKKIY